MDCSSVYTLIGTSAHLGNLIGQRSKTSTREVCGPRSDLRTAMDCALLLALDCTAFLPRKAPDSLARSLQYMSRAFHPKQRIEPDPLQVMTVLLTRRPARRKSLPINFNRKPAIVQPGVWWCIMTCSKPANRPIQQPFPVFGIYCVQYPSPAGHGPRASICSLLAEPSLQATS